jgi:hypothetical protein
MRGRSNVDDLCLCLEYRRYWEKVWNLESVERGGRGGEMTLFRELT